MSADTINVFITKQHILTFENIIEDKDTIIYFQSCKSDWHTHGNMFVDEFDCAIESVPQHIFKLLKNGKLLIAENFYNQTIETTLEDTRYIGDLSYLESGEKIVFFRV